MLYSIDRLSLVSRGNRTFTLIELLAVIAVIGLLAGLLLPVVSRTKGAGRSTVCLGNLRQIGMALELYVQENQNRMPTMIDHGASTNQPASTNAVDLPSPDRVLARTLGSRQSWRCPSDQAQIFEQTGASYSWNNLLNGQNAEHLRWLTMALEPHQVPVFFDKQAFHRARGQGLGVNYLYADGHIKNRFAVEGTK